jgi:predicted PurR-regulated permease PerM
MDRRHVLAGIVALVGLIAAYVLREVLATVFFAATVAYVLSPVERWYTRRGVSSWWAALATTLTGVGIAVVVLSPLVGVLYFRFGALADLLSSVPVPEELTVSYLGFTRTVRPARQIPAVTEFLEGFALSLAQVAPVFAIKATLFSMVVFALLMARDQLHGTLWAVVPREYHDVAHRLTERTSETLFAIYVLQAATALATFAISVPVFVALGYRYPFTLATVAGFLQFLPIVGPSVLVVGVAVLDVAIGNVTRAALFLAVGLVLIAWLPDPLVRPRLARRTADMPGSLYFVGFTGGLFTLGVVGVVAGPLIVSLLSESVRVLADEMRTSHWQQGAVTEYGPPTGDTPSSRPVDDTAPTDAPDADSPTSDGNGGAQ